MKKSLIVTLALVFVLGIAGTAFANPYSDVPAGHWAYKAVVDLQKAGVMEGAGGKFMGNQTLTRYEIAAITARAMAKADKADAAAKATIDKLAVEFSKELNDLGVRVAKLEKQSQNIKIGGESRIRYTDASSNTGTGLDSTNGFDWRQRLHLNAQVSENVKYTARVEVTGNFNGAASSSAVFNRNFFTISNMVDGLDTVQVGRFGLYAGNYLAVGKTSNNDGIAFATKAGEFDLNGFWTQQEAKVEYKGAFVTKAWDDLSVNVGYLEAEQGANFPAAKAYDIGVWYNFAPGWNFVGEYVDTNNKVGADGKGWAAQLTYTTGKSNIKKFFSTANVVDPTKAGEHGFAVSYRDIDANGLPGESTYSQFGYYKGNTTTPVAAADDVKGLWYGYQYVIQKNVLLNVEYQDVENQAGTADAKYASAYVQFFF